MKKELQIFAEKKMKERNENNISKLYKENKKNDILYMGITATFL